jgi:hypothetical protein
VNFAALTCMVIIPTAAWAQTGASGFAGVARDASGAVLPGVTVGASSPALIERVRIVVTDGEGLYKITETTSRDPIGSCRISTQREC